MIYCYDPRAIAARTRAVYHKYVEELGRPKCKPIIGRMVKVHNIPQNRWPCIKCFGIGKRRSAKV